MSARTIIVVVLALVCGLCAAVGIQGMRRAPKAVAEVVAEPIAKDSVVAVLAPVAKGQLIQAADVELQELPKAFVPPGALKQTADVVGHRAQIALVKGDVVTDRMLMQERTGNLGHRIQPGWRAFTIMAAGPSSSLAGGLETGDRVDVLLTRASQGGPAGAMAGSRATVLLQDIEVLAVNPKDENALSNKLAPHEVTSATLHVSLHDAAALDQAQATGVLHLALRNPGGDTSPSADELAELRGSGKRPIKIQARNLTTEEAGLLVRGDCVDVRDTLQGPGGESDAPGLGETIVEEARILDIHAKVERSPKGRLDLSGVLTVTLLVDPQQAERLEQVQASGTLGLALHRPGDAAKGPKAPEPSFVDVTEQTRTLRGTRYGTDRFTTRVALPPAPAPSGFAKVPGKR